MSDIIYEKYDHTALLTLNKTASMNALCTDFLDDISHSLDDAESDPQIYTVIITGSGKSFIAGADIEEMVDMSKDEIYQWSALGSQLNLRIEKMKLPVIAAINGYALGGGLELAMACDIRIASEAAKMGLPETSLGVICGAGGTQRLPALVGEGIARELIYTARIIDAQEALRIGLVNKVTSANTLLEEAFTMAHQIEKNGQLAIRAAKEAISYSAASYNPCSREDGCLRERELFSSLFETEDQKIGMKGFLKKDKNIIFKNR